MRFPWRARGISGQPAPKAVEQPTQDQGQQQKPPDMSIYNPGRAQPMQPQSQGTPYGAAAQKQEPESPFAQYQNRMAGIADLQRRQQDYLTRTFGSQGSQPTPPPPPAQPQQTKYTAPGFMEYGQYGGPMTYGGQSDFGNFAYAPITERPQPFVAEYRGFDGAVSDKPNFGQRDAFIQQINDGMMPYYGGQKQGAPQMDFQSMWKSAGDMVDKGYQNPFAAPPQQMPSLEQYLAQYAPEQVYNTNMYYG